MSYTNHSLGENQQFGLENCIYDEKKGRSSDKIYVKVPSFTNNSEDKNTASKFNSKQSSFKNSNKCHQECAQSPFHLSQNDDDSSQGDDLCSHVQQSFKDQVQVHRIHGVKRIQPIQVAYLEQKDREPQEQELSTCKEILGSSSSSDEGKSQEMEEYSSHDCVQPLGHGEDIFEKKKQIYQKITLLQLCLQDKFNGDDQQSSQESRLSPVNKGIERSNLLLITPLEKSHDVAWSQSRELQEFLKRKDFGSPLPANEILLPFQRAKKLLKATLHDPSSPVNKKAATFQSDSSLSIDQLLKTETPMKISAYKSMTLHIFQSLNLIKQMKEVPQLASHQCVPFTFTKPGMKKLIIFDLDETLIHCQREELLIENEDDDEDFKFVPDITIQITDPEQEELINTSFSIRPYALDCLKVANQLYEVAVFTAGYDWYANPILDYLDPTGELIQHRCYRQHATYMEDEGFFVKDLRIFQGIDLKNVMIVDNYVHSFAFHLENGIPVVPFFGEKDDSELLKVARYIEVIHDREDVRHANRDAFQLQKILQTDIHTFIKYYDLDELLKLNEELLTDRQTTVENDREEEEEKVSDSTPFTKNAANLDFFSYDLNPLQFLMPSGQDLLSRKESSQQNSSQNATPIRKERSSTIQKESHADLKIDIPEKRQLERENDEHSLSASLPSKKRIKRRMASFFGSSSIPKLIEAPNRISKISATDDKSCGKAPKVSKKVEEDLSKLQQALSRAYKKNFVPKSQISLPK